ncbi:FAD-dependent oxidoreductase [Saccharibacillus sp. CPCC 101409]|uniref:NAD(P)/FAD-dependent oxidoreductase n=1 Tax=Saccharibacillus sp. CPCC 101409 TaxID=3058041 RepID=UPI002672DED9|nr:FAD-dependent oxidoreductase [Saccharibacillus sp. CPCC 101409]MDO3408281.1 FAD-dependent oxidoreductase [Saccharibacillus sp. CPCC 101409]
MKTSEAAVVERKHGRTAQNGAFTVVVIGGGYAGLQTLLALRKELGPDAANLILIDRNESHLQKVMLFRRAASAENIEVPFTRLRRHGAAFIRAEVRNIDRESRAVELELPDGTKAVQSYDRLVIAAGSIAAAAPADRGGIELAGPGEADRIRGELRRLVDRAAGGGTMPRVVVVGGGASGIETAAEIAAGLKRMAAQAGLPAERGAAVTLLDRGERLLPQASAYVSGRLEAELRKAGVETLSGRRAARFADGAVELESGERLDAGLCIWTTGQRANPVCAAWGLPVDPEGRVLTETGYRLKGSADIYAVGDCARVCDPSTGRIDGMSCREATAQARLLAKAIAADWEHRPAPAHRAAPFVLCLALGPDRGFAWTRFLHRDIVLTGALGLKAREYTWSLTNLLGK